MKKTWVCLVVCGTMGLSWAGNPPNHGVVWDEAAQTMTITLPSGSFSLGDDYWISNSVYDVAGNYIAPSNCPTSVPHFVVKGKSDSLLYGWLHVYNKGVSRTAPNALWSIEGGTFVFHFTDTGNFCTFAGRPDIRVEVGPEGKIGFRSDSPGQLNAAGNITLRGGMIVDDRAGTMAAVGSVASNSATSFANPKAKAQALLMTGRLNVAACEKPSVILATYLQCDMRSLRYPVEFAVEEGGTLRIDAQMTDYTATDGTVYPGGFRKTGGGTLILTEPSDLTGTIEVQDGVLKLAKGAGIGAAKLIVHPAAKIVLADGSVLNGPIQTIVPPAIVNEAEVHLDAALLATKKAYTVGNNYVRIRNLGTLSNEFVSMAGTPYIMPDAFGEGKPAYNFANSCYKMSGFTNHGDSVTAFVVYRQPQYNLSWAPTFQLIDRTFLITNNLTSDASSDPGYRNTTNGTTWNNANGMYCANGSARTDSSGKFTGYNYRFFLYYNTYAAMTQQRPVTEPFVEVCRIFPKSGTQMQTQHRQVYSNIVYAVTNTVNAAVKEMHHDYMLLNARLAFPSQENSVKNMAAGQMGEILVYFRNLSDAETETVQQYLRKKWLDVPTSEPYAPVNVEVEEGARAYAALANTENVSKTGAGTLAMDATAAVAQDTLTVQTGSVEFAKALIGSKAKVWVDPSDESTVSLNANGCVVGFANKGSLGGTFTCMNSNNANVTLGNTYSASHKMLQYPAWGNSGSVFDYDGFSLEGDATNSQSVTYFAILSQNLTQGDPNWNCAFLIGPKRSAISSTTDPTTRLGLQSSYPDGRTDKAQYWFAIGKNGDLQMYSCAAWTTNDYALPTLCAAENTVKGTLMMLENPADGGSNCLSRSDTISDRNYGLVRIGGRILANAATSEHWTGGIGELLIFNETLTSAEKSSIVDYLRKKWLRNEETDVPAAIVGQLGVSTNSLGNLMLKDRAVINYTGAETAVNAISVAAGSQVFVAMNQEPAKRVPTPFIRYKTAQIAGKLTVTGNYAKRWHLKDDGAGTLWLRPVTGTVIMLRSGK